MTSTFGVASKCGGFFVVAERSGGKLRDGNNHQKPRHQTGQAVWGKDGHAASPPPRVLRHSRRSRVLLGIGADETLITHATYQSVITGIESGKI